MAKSRGTTSRAGKTRTDRPAGVAADRIDPRHGGKVKSVGAQTEVERQALTGPRGPGRQPKQIGPSTIRKASPGPGKVRQVGGGNWEDQVARQGGTTKAPGTRQSGSVRHVGPVSRAYAKLVEGRTPPLQSDLARFAPKRGQRLDKGVPILKSGVGRAHAWSVYAGQPGSKKGGITGVGASSTGDTILVSGRRRPFGGEAFDPRRDLVTPQSAIVPGGTDLYEETKEKFEEE